MADHPVPTSAHPGVQDWWAHAGLRPAVLSQLDADDLLVAGGAAFPDISEFQGVVDWDALQAAHAAGWISGVMIRAGFGTVRADAQFTRNRGQARDRGIPLMYYWFCYAAYNAPEAEADKFNQVVGPLQPSEAMVGDFEDDPSANRFPRGPAGYDWCRRFLTRLQAPQNATWWYTYPYFLTTVGLQGLWNTWPFWIADYGSALDSAFSPAIARQFTDAAGVSGVAGRCDLSRVVRGPLDQWLVPAPSPAPTPPPPPAIADSGGNYGMSVSVSVRPGTNRVDLLGIGTNGGIFHQYDLNGGAGLSGDAWENLGGDPDSRTVAGAWTSATTFIVVRTDVQGRVTFLLWDDATGWGAWSSDVGQVLVPAFLRDLGSPDPTISSVFVGAHVHEDAAGVASSRGLIVPHQ
jgi:GH25 family lysozyme M1 (1,4-beta-N-acetylmuramidase)